MSAMSIALSVLVLYAAFSSCNAGRFYGYPSGGWDKSWGGPGHYHHQHHEDYHGPYHSPHWHHDWHSGGHHGPGSDHHDWSDWKDHHHWPGSDHHDWSGWKDEHHWPRPGSDPPSRPGSGAKPALTPESGPTFVPGSGPTFVPGSGPTFAPGSGPTLMPESDPTSIPGSDPAFTGFESGQEGGSETGAEPPGSGPTFVSGSGPTFAPGSGPTFAPGSGPTLMPDPEQTSIPGSDPAFTGFESGQEEGSETGAEPPGSGSRFVTGSGPTIAPGLGPTFVSGSGPTFISGSGPTIMPDPEQTSIPGSDPAFTGFESGQGVESGQKEGSETGAESEGNVFQTPASNDNEKDRFPELPEEETERTGSIQDNFETTFAPIDAFSNNNPGPNAPAKTAEILQVIKNVFQLPSGFSEPLALANRQGEPSPPRAAATRDACAAQKATLPNFDAPSRRKSVSKCYEYIWLLKNRADREATDDDCVAQRKANGEFFISVVGGHDTVVGEYPHMAAIGWKALNGSWVFKCGGSLISPKWILTAAHCSKASSLDTTIADTVPRIARLGDKNILDRDSNFESAQDVTIVRVVSHPSYKAPRKYFDIALMELAEEVEFSKLIQPACLWSKFNTAEIGNRVNLTGWGVVEVATQKTSPELQAAEVDLIAPQQCDQLLRPSCNRLWCGIQDHQICAGQLSGKVDACRGDSGGPMQVKINIPISTQGQLSYLLGVTSFGIGCARANTPGVYTRVSSFIDWIENIVWP